MFYYDRFWYMNTDNARRRYAFQAVGFRWIPLPLLFSSQALHMYFKSGWHIQGRTMITGLFLRIDAVSGAENLTYRETLYCT